VLVTTGKSGDRNGVFFLKVPPPHPPLWGFAGKCGARTGSPPPPPFFCPQYRFPFPPIGPTAALFGRRNIGFLFFLFQNQGWRLVGTSLASSWVGRSFGSLSSYFNPIWYFRCFFALTDTFLRRRLTPFPPSHSEVFRLFPSASVSGLDGGRQW